MTGEVTIETNGRRYGGWLSVSVSRSIEAFAGTFQFQGSERSPTDPLGRPLRMGDEVVVRIGGVKLITGFIDKIDPRYDERSHTIDIAGRSKTLDLVDCSAAPDPSEWHDRKLDQIISELVKPFGLTVRTETDVGLPFVVFKLEPSEAIHSAIVRAAAQRAVLVTDNGDGDLVLTRVGRDRAGVALKKGERIKRARGSFSDRDRFSVYSVLGQRRSTDDTSEEVDEPETQVLGVAKDLGVTRYRPLDILAEEPGSVAELEARAKWEAVTRQGAAIRATLTVQDWSHPGGLWLPNQRVQVEDSWLGIRREMLIAGVNWMLDDDGRRSILTIAPPESFDLLASIEISKSSGDTWQ